MEERFKAFTLIELLIVVAIIGILEAIAVPNFMNAQIRAKVAKVEADMKTIATGLESYRVDNNSYPGDHDLDKYMVGEDGLFHLTTPVAYIPSLPVEPFMDKKVANFLGIGGSNAYAREGRPDYELGSGADNGGNMKVQAYSIMSYGPDRDDDNGPHDSFPFGTDHDRYDASNGIISNGNIFRFGGDWRSGCIIMDWGKFNIGSRCQ